ncbi:glycosyltransferase [Acinetobacter sp.]|uniref:glycosyltransferase n=1 Tax=Acinetobacter sp. TaxID=472 RepID=UPI00388DCE3F
MKTLIVFSHLRWNFVFQRPQHLLTRLSKYYNILFVEEPVNSGSVKLEISDVASNIKVIVPHLHEEGWGFTDPQMAAMGPMVKAWVDESCDVSDGYGIWFYTPSALPLKDYFTPEFTIFDVMDELSLFAGAPIHLKKREAELLRTADVVTAGGPSLARAKQGVRPDTLSLPSCVDAAHYSPRRACGAEVLTHDGDALQAHISGPRIGFFGVIDERLDIDLVAAVADSNPRWQVVMVGPVVKIDPASLPKRPNIHYLGGQSYQILPQLVQGWDVCMMPFAINDATKFISPTKTLEYMAAEKPIVSTAVHDVIELYGDVVEIGYDHSEFIGNIEKLLHEEPTQAAQRIITGTEIVARCTWDATAEKIHDAIEAAIKAKKPGVQSIRYVV